MSIKGGVVDSDYRGEITVLLKNNGDTPYSILPTDKIAQFIFEHAASPYIETVSSLPSSHRNQGGFGSTDKTSHPQPPTTARRTTHTTFRLDENCVLYINNANPFRPVARRIKAPVCKSMTPNLSENTKIEIHNIDTDDHLLSPILSQTTPDLPKSPTPTTNQLPTPTSIDKVNTTLPKKITFSRDALHRATGFYNTQNLIKHLHELGQDTVQIQSIPKVDAVNPGETASLPSQKRQTNPSTLPRHYSDIWHMDIGHGPCTAIGGARYTLLLVDKFTRFKFLFSLKNLTTSLLEAMKRFCLLCGTKQN